MRPSAQDEFEALEVRARRQAARAQRLTRWVAFGVVPAVTLGLFWLFGVLRLERYPFLQEAERTLLAVHAAQQAHFAQHRRYATRFDELSWTPEVERFHTCFLGEAEVLPPTGEGAEAMGFDALPALADEWVVGVNGECPACFYVAACVVRLPWNDMVSPQFISSQRGGGRDGTVVRPAGVVFSPGMRP